MELSELAYENGTYYRIKEVTESAFKVRREKEKVEVKKLGYPQFLEYHLDGPPKKIGELMKGMSNFPSDANAYLMGSPTTVKDMRCYIPVEFYIIIG